MFHNFKKNVNTKIFDYCVRNIRKQHKVICDRESPVVIVSQLCNRDLYMYMAAVKTFTTFVKPHKVIIVSDGLTNNNIAILDDFIANLTIINVDSVDTEGFPQGGTWERLLTIIDESRFHYVIQLDADTLTLRDIPEVQECVFQNRSFTLGTFMGQKIITFKEATGLVENYSESNHVQIRAELVMEKIDQSNQLKYVRGCSGFAGFGKGSCNKQQLKEISSKIMEVIGKEKWSEWGSEQVSSNIMVANSVSPYVLPIEKYNYFKPGIIMDNYNFLHFI